MWHVRPAPPAAHILLRRELHARRRALRAVEDDLFWLRDDARTNPEVLAHLAAENRYTDFVCAHTRPHAEALFAELKGRMKETDADAPYAWGAYMYYTRTEAGKAYRIECRRPRAEGGAEAVLLDVNAIAAGKEMCDVHTMAVSPDHAAIAYAVDFAGSETYTIRFKLAEEPTGQHSIPDVIEGTTGDLEWGADRETLYYTTHDEQHRPHKVWRHRLGTSQSADECLFTEDDDRFWVGISRTLTDDFLIVHTSSKMTGEAHFVPLRGDGAGTLHLIQPRQHDVLYEVDHARCKGEDVFVIVTNRDGAKNSKIMVTRVSAPSGEHWVDLVPHSRERKIDAVHITAHGWAIVGREKGFEQIWLANSADAETGALQALSGAAPPHVGLFRIPNPDPVYFIGPAKGNVEYDSRVFRFQYSSPNTPMMTCELPLDIVPSVPAGEVRDARWDSVRVLKQREVPNCDTSLYCTHRVHATAKDGTRIPISILYKPSALGLEKSATPADTDAPTPLRAPVPMFLEAYGSYGISFDMAFDSRVLSLCDRGIVYAVAHVRGGGEMGRFWYEDEGRLLKKKNTFTDFIACAEHLIASGWTTAGRIIAHGASAGGLLMGVVLNERPDLWAGILSQVGFVDVLVTMSDTSIPLTVTEWEEWGNPNEREYFEYIRTYSPMDNVRKQAYPPVLLTAGLNDYRVAYWEPAKFAQRLRAVNQPAPGKASPSTILLKVDMGAGHFSFTDRYAYLREKAFAYAWVLDTLRLLK